MANTTPAAPLTRQELLAQLQALAEPEYAAFSGALIPGSKPLLGVRLPTLRTLARQLVKAHGYAAATAALGNETLEEQLLRGFVTAYAPGDDAARRQRLESFLPYIENWSVCDSTAATCKFMRKAPAFWLPWLQGLALQNAAYPARFGLVCLLDHFTDTPAHRAAVLQSCAACPCPAPYTRLAVAWAVSIVAAKDPAQGLAFLQRDTLDAATHNKAIQKFCESRRVTDAQRAEARALRRPTK